MFWALRSTLINKKSASEFQFAKIEITCMHGLHTNQHNIANLIQMNQTIKITLFMKTHEQHKMHEKKRLGFKNLLLLERCFCPMTWFCNIPNAHIVATNNNVFKVKRKNTNILTTKSKWVINLFLRLLFMKSIFKKHLLTSLLFIATAYDKSISFSLLYN